MAAAAMTTDIITALLTTTTTMTPTIQMNNNGSWHACSWLGMAYASIGAVSECQGDDNGDGIFQVAKSA